ncbi:hypothetical protein GGR97_000237 [Wenyingzhuangia aestuarii]|nr:hypothetical protein [Wenyingzhuangia aestuarii]
MLFFSYANVNAQWSRGRRRIVLYQHEIGGNIGVSNFQSDFKANGPIDGLVTINGLSINATHSVHLLPRRYDASIFVKRLILKSNFGYSYGSFNNHGLGTGNELLYKNVDPSQDTRDGNADGKDYSRTPNNVLLARLTSKTSIITFGTQLEFYFKDITSYLHRFNKYRQKSKANPYIALGFGANYVSSTPSYDQEALNNNAGSNTAESGGLPDNYTPETITGIKGLVISATAAIGTRYKLSRSVDLVTEMKINYYLSDRIDAVNPDLKDTNSFGSQGTDADKFNDYNTVISVGIIYHLF